MHWSLRWSIQNSDSWSFNYIFQVSIVVENVPESTLKSENVRDIKKGGTFYTLKWVFYIFSVILLWFKVFENSPPFGIRQSLSLPAHPISWSDEWDDLEMSELVEGLHVFGVKDSSQNWGIEVSLFFFLRRMCLAVFCFQISSSLCHNNS